MTRRHDLIVLDLDGTLLDRSGAVSSRNVAAVCEARERGYEVVIATGRSHHESIRALRALEADGAAITAGGAMLCDAASGATLHRRVLDARLTHAVVDSLNRHGHVAHVLKDRHATGYDYLMVGAGTLDAATEWWIRTLDVTMDFAPMIAADPHPLDTVRVGTVSSGRELARIAAELREDLGERILLQHWPAVTESQATGAETHLLEVFSPRVDKWMMIETWCAEHDVDPQRTIAIGDGLNDIEMIRNAGLSIAMANAEPTVRRLAQRVTGDHNADGVAHALHQVFSGAW